jgi:hypothetical protein
MSATATTHHASHHVRAPWLAAAAVAAVIAGAGAVSLAIGSSGDSTSDQTPVLRTPTLQDYAQYNYLHGPRESFGGLDGHTLPAPRVGAGVGQASSLEGTVGGGHQWGGLDGHTPPALRSGVGQSQGGSSSPATTSGGQTQIGQ